MAQCTAKWGHATLSGAMNCPACSVKMRQAVGVPMPVPIPTTPPTQYAYMQKEVTEDLSLSGEQLRALYEEKVVDGRGQWGSGSVSLPSHTSTRNIAVHPNTPADVLVELYEGFEVVEALSNPNTPSELARSVFLDSNAKAAARSNAMFHPAVWNEDTWNKAISGELQYEYMWSAFTRRHAWHFSGNVFREEWLPREYRIEVMEAITKGRLEDGHASAALTNFTDNIDKMDDEEHAVLVRAMTSPTSLGLLNGADKVAQMRKLVMFDSRTPMEQVSVLLDTWAPEGPTNHLGSKIVEEVFEKRYDDITPEFAQRFSDYGYSAPLRHPRLPQAAIDGIADKIVAQAATVDQSESIAAWTTWHKIGDESARLLSSGRAPQRVVDLVYGVAERAGNSNAANVLLESGALDDERIISLIGMGGSAQGRRESAAQGRLSDGLADTLMKSNAKDLRIALANNPTLPDRHLLRLMKDQRHGSAVSHPAYLQVVSRMQERTGIHADNKDALAMVMSDVSPAKLLTLTPDSPIVTLALSLHRNP